MIIQFMARPRRTHSMPFSFAAGDEPGQIDFKFERGSTEFPS